MSLPYNVVIGDIQYSPYKDLYPYAKTVTVDFSEEIENQPTKAALETYAANWINSRGLPVTNLEVSVDELISENNTIGLGDTVQVINDLYGVNYESRIIETEFDVLTERYSNVVIGDKKATINDAISETATNETIVQQSGTTYTAGGGIDITSDVISSFLNKTTVWTNSSPSSSFAGQTVNDLNLSGYSYCLVKFKFYYSTSNYFWAIAKVGETTIVYGATYRNYQRTVELTSTSAIFSNCVYYGTYGTNSTQNSNNNIVPIQIIGIK